MENTLNNELQIENVSVHFGGLVALDSVSFHIKFGSIHAVLGENGAGKSTLINILGGFQPLTSGRVLLGEKELSRSGNKPKIHPEIAMVHQHFMLVPRFTVEENFAMSAPKTRLLSSLPNDHVKTCLAIAEKLSWEIPINAITQELPVGIQQRIEIIKALSTDAKIIILDEPTAVLNESEIVELFRVIKSLKEDGRMVILIAHKLDEIFAIADRATILRNGKVVETVEISQTTELELRNMMVGQDSENISDSFINNNSILSTELVLTTSNLEVLGDRGNEAVKGLDFSLYKGEILGIGGVDGNGQIELAESLVGIRKFLGKIECSKKIGYIPQDRQHDGLALKMSIKENFLITNPLPESAIAGEMISKSKTRQMVSRLVENYRIKVDSIEDFAQSLSGGNQQKIVVSRVLDQNPEVIVAMNPTRGLDFQSCEFVHQMLENARKNGAAIVLISTDREEIKAISTRSFELSRGQLLEMGESNHS